MLEHFANKTVLITGGTGSFGSTFARLLLQKSTVSKVIIFSRDEWKQWQLREHDPLFRDSRVRFFLGDIRDQERLQRAFQDVHIVIHAAALKQVPAAEYNPTEFVKTNVIGAMNITAAALDSGIEQVIALSTDKAVNPINLYGATKLCSDKLFIAANAYVGKKGYPRFSVVRYGNVIGSRGSLLPFWKELLSQGKKSLPITDLRMTRFWVTLDDAARFVAYIASIMQGSEVFIPKSSSVLIKDLSQALSPGIGLDVVGIRPGEKIHEVLLSHDEARTSVEGEKFYAILPQFDVHGGAKYTMKEKTTPVAADFELTSQNNPLFTTSTDQIHALISGENPCILW